MEPWDFLREKPLKINITMGYTFVFTISVLEAFSKFEKVREDSLIDLTHLSILSGETSP